MNKVKKSEKDKKPKKSPKKEKSGIDRGDFGKDENKRKIKEKPEKLFDWILK